MLPVKMIVSLLVMMCLLTACAAQPAPSPTAAPTVTLAPVPVPTNIPSAVPPQSGLSDGEYVAETSESYTTGTGHGWREYVKLTVSDGQIIDMEYDALKDGKKKSAATQAEYPMTPHPSQWVPQLNENLQAADNPNEVDAVAGATQSSQMIRKLYAAALANAKAGTVEAAIVD